MSYEKIKRGIQRFCDGTSCHGYVELYHSKTMFWRLCWFIICSVAFGLTLYQVSGAITEYMYGNSNTVILPAEENEIVYPPMHLCFFQWLYWVNFTKVIHNNYDKDAVLFALNFLTPIYSATNYSVDEAEVKLQKLMKVNNFKTLLQFYNSIALSVPILVDEPEKNNLSSYFDHREIMFEYPTFYYCYVISSRNVFRYFAEHPNLDDMEPGRKLVSFSLQNTNYNFNFNDMRNFISSQEYIQYMRFWMEDNTDYIIDDGMDYKLTDFSPPFRLLPNGFDDNDIAVLPENDDYNVNFRSSSCEWKSKPSSMCSSGEASVASNETCEFFCLAQAQQNNCRCMDLHFATFLQKDTTTSVCRDVFYVYNPTANEWAVAPYTLAINTQANQGCKNDTRNTFEFHQCFNKCVTPCRIWTFEMSVLITPMPQFARSITHKNITDIYIEYPLSTDILTMKEEDGQTWENFVGNVGGLLGIWTGASIVSLIQLFYLCCCVDIDHMPNWIHANRHKPAVIKVKSVNGKSNDVTARVKSVKLPKMINLGEKH